MTTTTPTHASAAMTASRRWLGRLGTVNLAALAALGIFVAMLIYGEFAYGRILQYSTISSLFINNAQLILIAVGLTMVIITGGIDLSVGAVVALSGVSGVMLANAGWNPVLVVVVMIGIGTLVGLASGSLIEFFGVQPFIATLSMMFLARGLASMLSTEPQSLADDSPLRQINASFTIIVGPLINNRIPNDLKVTPGVVIALLVVIAAQLFLTRTRSGRTIYAIGGSESSALLMGLPVRRTKLLVYAVSGTLAGLAAVVYTARLGSAQNITGIGWELDAIASAVIGGTLLTGGAGAVLGSLVGALVLGMITVLITRDGTIPPAATAIITGGILLVFVLLQRAVTARRSG
jgi:simple sugar transport system permease protein